MNTGVLKPDVYALQKSVIDLLEQIGSLMQRASQALGSADADGQYKQFEKEICDEAYKVKNLELRMAIVAPMKAGKSTIINSIIGHDLLPSRASAMTSLPTEIVFDARSQEPQLELSPELLSVFQKTFQVLKRKFQELDADCVKEKMAQHPHLKKLRQEIEDAVGFPLQTLVSGHDEVIKTLTFLNDLVRLCSLIAPLSDPLGSLTDIPRIYTPFWRSQGATQSESLGNLVIVDTPGPNEAGDGLQLKRVVRGQLKKSSVVLIVLDFTQLNTKAAEEIKRDVQSVIDVRGKKNLYVLINKVDQRREGDPMTREMVQQFVAADLGLGSVGHKNHTFETAARRAFSASSFLQELEQNPEASPQRLGTVRSLAQEVFGIDWEEDLENASSEELKQKAERLWKKSGFAPFLEEAISALMAEAAPRCMNGALTLAGNRLKQLRNDVILRSTAMNADEEKLRLEVGALKESLDRLEASRQKLQQVDIITASLRQELNSILENLKNEAKVDLASFFNKEEFQRGDFGEKARLGWEKLVAFMQKKEYKSKGKIEFASYAEANDFTNLVVQYPKERIEALLERVRKQVESCIENEQSKLTDSLERETKPIIEEASQRLDKTFNINLTLPNPQLQAKTDFRKPQIETDTRFVDQGYKEKTTKKRSFWNWLWILPYEETERVKRPDREEKYYIVSLQEITDQVNELIEQSIGNVKQGIDDYLGEDFKQRTETFFKNLNQYLTRYQDSLRQAQHDQKLSLEKKKELGGKLDKINRESCDAAGKVETYLGHTTFLIKD